MRLKFRDAVPARFFLRGLASVLCLACLGEAANVLLVVGNSNGTTAPGGLSIGDKFIRDRLRDSLGHAVQILPDSSSRDSVTRSANRADLIVVMESVTSTRLGDKLKAAANPIINCEAFIQDEMGLTATGPAGDPGMPSQFALGVQEKGDKIVIRNSEHPLAAGLNGTVQIYSQEKSITWGKVAPTAEVIASLAADTSGAAIYLYRKGVKLFDGATAAGMRIGFFMEDDNVTGTPNLMTRQGLALFDKAAAFALAGGAVTIARRKGGREVSASFALTRMKSGLHPGRDAMGRAFASQGLIPKAP